MPMKMCFNLLVQVKTCSCILYLMIVKCMAVIKPVGYKGVHYSVKVLSLQKGFYFCLYWQMLILTADPIWLSNFEF